ncbi:class IV adenylate cyclase [Maioricimonas sp. JC845]|uniref:class IV adenylate cyclase n=1 Tax=Maioricimonas sp. JC845 TaxID=3232138 RepID=UPI00345AF912
MADYEVEMKFPLRDADGVRARLEAMGATPGQQERQCDLYFAHPERDFARTDEAFRIRSIGDQNLVTYKGPLLDQQTKTRQEIELAFEDGSVAAQKMWELFRALGFNEVRRVQKTRTQYSMRWRDYDFSLALDSVDDLGEYVEIEVLADQSNWEAARDTALELVRELSLEDSERRSYLQMLLEQDAGSAG